MSKHAQTRHVHPSDPLNRGVTSSSENLGELFHHSPSPLSPFTAENRPS